MSFEEFRDFIKSLDQNMSIGVHGVKEETLLNEPDIAEKVLSKGLELKGWGGILSSVKMFGRVKDLGDADIKRIYQYAYGIGDDGNIINFLFGFPETITNSNGEEFYLGHFVENEIGKGQKNAGSELPLNVLCDEKRHISNKFVIGCIISPFNVRTIELRENPCFYGNSEDVQPFYDELFSDLEAKNIPNPKEMFEYSDVYAKHGISTEDDLGVQQYEQHHQEKGEQY